MCVQSKITTLIISNIKKYMKQKYNDVARQILIVW